MTCLFNNFLLEVTHFNPARRHPAWPSEWIDSVKKMKALPISLRIRISAA